MKHFKSGTSLLIATGLITILVLVSLGVTTIVASSVRQSANINRANQAYYAAEGALEEGLLASKNSGAGFSIPAQNVKFGMNCGGGNANSVDCLAQNSFKATYEIQGLVPTASQYIGGFFPGLYSIPTPGTGNAASSCDSLNPVLIDFQYPAGNPNAGTYSPEDHPCNWNKITVGDVVTIPLYVTTADPSLLGGGLTSASCTDDLANPGMKICNPVDLGLSELKVRVRTPCADGSEMCDTSARYDLVFSSSDPNAQFGGDQPIVSWQINGTDPGGQVKYGLGPKILYSVIGGQGQWPLTTAVIHASKINSASSFLVLKESHTAVDLKTINGVIIDFLKNIKTPLPNNNWDQQQIFKPTLKLNVIHTLVEDITNNTIPYLEYQILTNSNVSPTDVVQTLTAEGFSGTFKQVLEIKQPHQGGILEYVIQQ